MSAPHSLVAPTHQPVAVRRALEFVQAVARSEFDVDPWEEAKTANGWRAEAREIADALAGKPGGG